jgi:hypothetical protein
MELAAQSLAPSGRVAAAYAEGLRRFAVTESFSRVVNGDGKKVDPHGLFSILLDRAEECSVELVCQKP